MLATQSFNNLKVSKEIEAKEKIQSFFESTLNSQEELYTLLQQLNIDSYILSKELPNSSLVSLLRFCTDRNYFSLFQQVLSLFLTSINYTTKNKSIYKTTEVKNILVNYTYFFEKFVLMNNNFSFLDISFFKHDSLYQSNLSAFLKHICKDKNSTLNDILVPYIQHNIDTLSSFKKFDKINIKKIENFEFLKFKNIFKILDLNTIDKTISYILENNINDDFINQSLLDISKEDRSFIFHNILFMIAQNSHSANYSQRISFLMSIRFNADFDIKSSYLENEKVRYILLIQDF